MMLWPWPMGEHLITRRGLPTPYTQLMSARLGLIPPRGCCCSEKLVHTHVFVGYSAQLNSGRIKLYENEAIAGYQLHKL